MTWSCDGSAIPRAGGVSSTPRLFGSITGASGILDPRFRGDDDRERGSTPSLRGAKRRSNPFFLYVARWIASRSLSSGAHSRDPLARNDVEKAQHRIPAARFARVLLKSPPLKSEGVGNAGCQCTRSRAWCVGSTRVGHREVTGKSPGIPARNGFNGFLRALPGDRALLPPSPELLLANLTPASGVRTTRLRRPHQHVSSNRAAASTASRSALMTLRNAPLSGRDGENDGVDLGQA
jgi:hypothetical protein